MFKLQENYFLLKIMGFSFFSFISYKLIINIFKNVEKNNKKIEELKLLLKKFNENVDKINNSKNASKELDEISNKSGYYNYKNTKLVSNLSYVDKKRKFSEYENVDLYKVVFTGGPCAGKSTAIAVISEKLRDLGFSVFCIPEAASMIFQSGGNLDLKNYSDEQKIRFQYHLMTLQTNLEDSLTDLAFTNSNKKKIILCDRGVMDGSAYLSEELWHQLIDDYGIDITRLRDKRYDLVVHLVTAADGAAKFFSLSNNNARHEELDYAIELDKNIQNSYMSHPNYFCIDNESQKDFEEKIKNTVNVVLKQIGINDNYALLNIYFLRDPKNELLNILEKEGIKTIKFDLEDLIFFEDETKIQYYRKRKSMNNSFNYIKCTKTIHLNKPFEVKRQITRKEYISIKNIDVKDKYLIKRVRINFAWKKKLFVLDKFNLENLKFMILNEQTNEITANKGYPKIIEKNLYKNINCDKNYFVEYLAKYGLKNFSNDDITELKEFYY